LLVVLGALVQQDLVAVEREVKVDPVAVVAVVDTPDFSSVQLLKQMR
tara:strand:+ start:80 stop:220 length:141 start_codon:yes stop_codon:yes gene_type:complete